MFHTFGPGLRNRQKSRKRSAISVTVQLVQLWHTQLTPWPQPLEKPRKSALAEARRSAGARRLQRLGRQGNGRFLPLELLPSVPSVGLALAAWIWLQR